MSVINEHNGDYPDDKPDPDGFICRTFGGYPIRIETATGTVYIRGDELGDPGDYRQLLHSAETWMKKNINGVKVTNKDTGRDIKIGKEARHHITRSKANINKIQSSVATIALLEYVKHYSTESDKKERPEILAIHVYKGKLCINNDELDVYMHVIEANNGNYLYDQTIMKSSPSSHVLPGF